MLNRTKEHDMDLSEHERRRLTGIEKSLIVEAPRLQRAFGRWSTRPLRVDRVRTAVRAVLARAATLVVLSMIVLALGATLMVLGVVQGRPAAAVVGLLAAQFGPWLIARSARPRPARPPRRPLALR